MYIHTYNLLSYYVISYYSILYYVMLYYIIPCWTSRVGDKAPHQYRGKCIPYMLDFTLDAAAAAAAVKLLCSAWF